MAARTHARLIPVADVAARDLDAWAELARAAGEPNPFFEPEFVLPAIANLPEAAGASLIVNEDTEGWVSCLPVKVGRWRHVMNAARGLRSRYSYASTPLVRGGRAPDQMPALIDAARRLTGKRLLVLERYRADGPVGDAFAAVIESGSVIEAVGIASERAMLRRRDDAEYLVGISKHHARDLRRRQRRLREAVDDEVECLDLSSDPDAAAIFLALEASGWKGREGTAMGSDPSTAAFFTELCENFRSQGRLEMLALRAREDVIAMVCNLRSGEGSYSLKMAHDENYSKFSPGTQLEVDNAKHFHAGGSAWMDSCAEPDNEMMNRLWPERLKQRTTVLGPADVRGKLTKSALGVAAEVRRRTRRRR